MAQERQINPMVKMALEYGPIILFLSPICG